jgi:hypothetical protein
MKWKGLITKVHPFQSCLFSKKSEPRVPETTLDTQLGLDQVWSESSILISLGISNWFIFSTLKIFQKYQVSRLRDIFKKSDWQQLKNVSQE